VEEYGKNAPNFVKYAASKTLAERAAWQLIKEQNPQFDLVTILPSYLWGVRTISYQLVTNSRYLFQEIISETTSDIKGSNSLILGPLTKARQENYKGEKLLEELQFVDVRDAAKLHVDALVSPVTGGQRITGSAATVTIQQICKSHSRE
jgi:nucleoside-diphosphate-sugar epimerase